MYRFSRMRSDEVGVEPVADALREPRLQAATGEADAEGGAEQSEPHDARG